MEKYRLLLADNATAFSMSLVMLLEGDFQVRLCADGLQAMEQLELFCPDVLVADLTLTGVDGLSLLQAAADLPRRPGLLAVTRICTDYVENRAWQIGVDYLMRKPCDIRCLAERIRDLCHRDEMAPASRSVRSGVGGILLELGLPMGRGGFRYLESLIRLYSKDCNRSLTKDLYPTVGREYGINGQAVERAVRGVIMDAWEKRNDQLWRRYFTPGPQGTVPRPTNREFIATISAVMCFRERILA